MRLKFFSFILAGVVVCVHQAHAQNQARQNSWLGAAKTAHAPQVPVQTLNNLLKGQSGSIRTMVCTYTDQNLTDTKAFGDGTLQDGSNQWTCDMQSKSVTGGGAIDVVVKFKLTQGAAKSSGVAVAFDFQQWSAKNYVMLPSAIYNGNRNRVVDRKYATGMDPKDLYKRDLPLTTTSLPQLSPKVNTVSRVELNTGSTATPAMTFYDPVKKTGFILLTEQAGKFGNYGLSVEENAGRSSASFIVSAPSVRSQRPAFIGMEPSPDRGVDIKAGDEITIKFRVYSFKAADMSAFLSKFHSVRKAVTGESNPRDQVPFSSMFDLLTKKIDDTRWYGGPNKFYKNENAYWITLGWVGGLMNTFPMLVLNDSLHHKRAQQTFDFAIPTTQSKSGYFYSLIDSKGVVGSREGYESNPELTLVRRNGDVLFWMVKQFMLLKSQGNDAKIKPVWESSVKKLAYAFVKTWDKYKAFGNFVNAETGDIAVFNSTSGASVVGGLALASKYFNEPSFLRVASEAGLKYYQNDVLKTGQTTGCCSDILQNADSETAFGLMTSYMALYEVTKQPAWLTRAKTLGDLSATWTVSYDYKFPKNSTLDRLGANISGAVWASTQNKHAAPGVCATSADPLFKLFRYTNQRRYAVLLREIQHAHTEVVERADRVTNGAGPGSVTERIQLSDAEGADKIGNLPKNSTGWCELNGALMATEIPGIYVQTDKNVFFVFDHVNAKVVKRDASGVTLEITNKTKFDASIAVFAETGAQARAAQGYTAFLNWPKVKVAAGQKRTVQISKSGKIAGNS